MIRDHIRKKKTIAYMATHSRIIKQQKLLLLAVSRSTKAPSEVWDSRKLTPVSHMEVGCSRIWGLKPTTLTFVTPQIVIIATKCNTNAKYNNITAKYNNIINAKCNNFPTQNVIIFLYENVITQIVITPELQVCST